MRFGGTDDVIVVNALGAGPGRRPETETAGAKLSEGREMWRASWLRRANMDWAGLWEKERGREI